MPKDDKLLRIFDRDTYYTVYGPKAKDIAIDHLRTQQSISNYGGSKEDDSQQPLQCVHIRKNVCLFLCFVEFVENLAVLFFFFFVFSALKKIAHNRIFFGFFCFVFFFGERKKTEKKTKQKKILEAVIHDFLMRRQNKIEIYEKDTETGVWVVAKKASPGNMGNLNDIGIDTMIGNSASQGSMTMSLNVSFIKNKLQLGVALYDSNNNDQTLQFVGFIDNHTFNNLQSLIVANGVRECLMKPKNAFKNFENDFKKIQVLIVFIFLFFKQRKAKHTIHGT